MTLVLLLLEEPGQRMEEVADQVEDLSSTISEDT